MARPPTIRKRRQTPTAGINNRSEKANAARAAAVGIAPLLPLSGAA
jgi:hypothetical protein